MFSSVIIGHVERVKKYASQNIFSFDDILDMKNGALPTPSESDEFVVWFDSQPVCYFIVDHPEHGRSHYFQIKPDYFSSMPSQESILKIFDFFNICDLPEQKFIKEIPEQNTVQIIVPFNTLN